MSFEHLKRREFRIFSAEEMLTLPPAEYLIEDMVEENSLNVLYGPSGSGKSFFAFDMALHIASGRPWCDRPVKHGYVIYVAAEGYRVLADRLRAWCKFYRCGPPEHLLMAIEPVDLSGGWKTLEEFLIKAVGSADMVQASFDDEGEVISEHEVPLRLVIFDTLARCVGNIDENSAQDMGNVVKWLDTLRDKSVTGLETSVMVVHHSSKHAAAERGSTALRGAADTMLYVGRDKYGPILKCTKQKGAEPFEPMDFQIVQLDTKREPVLVQREKIEQVAAQRISPEAQKPIRPIRLGPTQTKALITIADSAGPEGLTVSEWSRLLAIDVPQMVRIKTVLVRYGFVLNEPLTRNFKVTRSGLKFLQEVRLIGEVEEVTETVGPPLTIVRDG